MSGPGTLIALLAEGIEHLERVSRETDAGLLERMKAELARMKAMEKMAALQNAGARLANCAFNLAQRDPRQFTARDIDALNEARKRWDEAASK